MRFNHQNIVRASYAASQSRLEVIFRTIDAHMEMYLMTSHHMVIGCSTVEKSWQLHCSAMRYLVKKNNCNKNGALCTSKSVLISIIGEPCLKESRVSMTQQLLAIDITAIELMNTLLLDTLLLNTLLLNTLLLTTLQRVISELLNAHSH